MTMNQQASESSVNEDDSFVQRTRELLAKGGATRRGITDDEYVSLARDAWDRCATDQVYRMKLLTDPVVEPELAAEAPDRFREAGLPYCTLIARVGADGELVDAPPGYQRQQAEGALLLHMPFGSPTGGEVPNPAEPADYLFAFLDVLGFSSLLEKSGLDALLGCYERLVGVALLPSSEAHPWSVAHALVRGELVPGLMWLPIQTAYFSDSLLLWVPYHPSHVEQFLRRCSAVFCAALAEGLPIRGAISAGRAVLDKKRGIYLGPALVEAVHLESESDWIGICLAASWKSESLRIPVPPDCVFIYEPPMKVEGSLLSSGLVLDWPRVWRETRHDSALRFLEELRRPDLPDALKARYDAATAFWFHSEQNQDWCLPPGWTRHTPWSRDGRDSRGQT